MLGTFKVRRSIEISFMALPPYPCTKPKERKPRDSGPAERGGGAVRADGTGGLGCGGGAAGGMIRTSSEPMRTPAVCSPFGERGDLDATATGSSRTRDRSSPTPGCESPVAAGGLVIARGPAATGRKRGLAGPSMVTDGGGFGPAA
jgi:hypothetical protein